MAAVFINRLRGKMKLESDPTTIYGLTGGKGTLDRELTRADLQSSSPYNTYSSPACRRGRSAIRAVPRSWRR